MAVKTTRVGAGTLTLGSAEDLMTLSSQVITCAVEPEGDSEDAQEVLSGEFIEGAYSETFNLTGEFFQDLSDTAGVTEFTWTNSGQVVPFKFVPNTAKGKEVSGNLRVIATKVGGEVGQNATAEFEFPIIGKPSIGAVSI